MSKRRPRHPSAQRTARGVLAARAGGGRGLRRLRLVWVWAALALCATCWVSDARAQSWVSDVQLGISSGFEGGFTGCAIRAVTTIVTA